MMASATQHDPSLATHGYSVLPGVFPLSVIDHWIAELQTAFAQSSDEATAFRAREGAVYAARNVLEWFPAAKDLWRGAPLEPFLAAELGEQFGLVRALYFDKPPERTWALPWHKDLTIAVREHRDALGVFSHPTRKAGVPHLEAPVELLERMLTLRIHLDDVSEENGPLRVLPGSHREGKSMRGDTLGEATIFANAGDVLAMRPLIAHASGASQEGTTRHRRILHLEFAADRELPAGIAWHTFLGREGD